jgi:hypothetical protein
MKRVGLGALGARGCVFIDPARNHLVVVGHGDEAASRGGRKKGRT